jgi:PAS domain S-box-containing protein
MSLQPATPLERRVLVHAPRGRDATVISQVLHAQGMHAAVCGTLAALTEALSAGAGSAFVTEESLTDAPLDALGTWIERQPPWSDFPFVVLVARRVGRRPNDATGVLARLGNVVLLERPLNAETLASAARSALRARDRQYETRRHLGEQEEARLAERLANAEAIRANEALEVAVDAGELGTFHCPWPLAVVESNAKCKEHFWLPPDEHIDLDGFYSILHEDDRARVRAAIDAAVDGRALFDVEYRTVSPQGAWRWIRAKGRVYRDNAGRPIRFDGVTLDISRQKRLEEEREALLAAERQARLDAERASRMKDEFLATLSHELRTPLSAILGWTHLLGRAAGSVDVAKAAATIERNARAQARLIEELLDVSRITSGSLRLDVQPVSIAAMFETVVSSLKPAADARSITLRQVEGPGVGEILADASRLQQIVWNLLSNAIKFTPLGGHVTLAAERQPTGVTLTVSDDGVGIAPDFLPHVFERFRQAESSEARTHGGLGLGLAIVRQLVELHGGTVEAASDGLGRGTTFSVRIPTQPAAVADLAPVAVEPVPVASTAPVALDADLSGTRILIVDDEPDGREMLTHMLESWGAQVRSAASADEALAALGDERPDLLISDIGMPRVDGYELMRRVRALPVPVGRDLPAIALTAFARGEDAAKAQQAGYGVHLPKPVDPSRLYSTIARVLRDGVTQRSSGQLKTG